MNVIENFDKIFQSFCQFVWIYAVTLRKKEYLKYSQTKSVNTQSSVYRTEKDETIFK